MNITHGLPLRAGSLSYLRGGGAARGGITINVYPTGKGGVVDGRHRITVARERGAKTVVATVIGVGPRGGQRWRYTGPVKI
jgi:hypothetical protein